MNRFIDFYSVLFILVRHISIPIDWNIVTDWMRCLHQTIAQIHDHILNDEYSAEIVTNKLKELELELE